MNVRILSSTNNAEKLCATAARLTKGLDCTDTDVRDAIESCISKGHESVLEHASYTFLIEHVSRVCLAQMSRHRIGVSLSVESQRRELEGSTMSAPDQMGKKGLDLFNGAYDKCLRTYYKLIDWGEKPEDARYILPQALNCNMIATFNGRSLRHFIKLRMTKEAQSEIRELATKIYNIVVLKDPYMFEDLKKRSEAE